MNDLSYVRENYLAVTDEIARVAKAAGRPIPTLVCVTKSATDEEVLALADCGIAAYGENRSDLFCRRRELLSEHPEISANFIGHLQTNKVKYIAKTVSLIQSVDSFSLAKEIDRHAEKNGRSIPILLEVNSGREAAKGGVDPDGFMDLYRAVRELPHVSVHGVMTMGPDCDCEEDYRPYFRLTYDLFRPLAESGGFATEHPILSMGMSDSYRVAIAEGSTMIRVGRRLFQKPIAAL